MAERNVPIMMGDGKEYMMSDAEAKAYYNGLPRSDSAAGIFPLARYNMLMKQSPAAASKLLNWYKALKPNKWGTKIFQGVSNTNLPATVGKMTTAGGKVPAVVEGMANGAIKLSGKAKAQLAGMGVAGIAGMGYGAYTGDNNDTVSDINDDGAMLKGLADIQAKQDVNSKSPFPFPMTPGSRPDFSDQMGNLQATPYQDAMEFSGDRVNEVRAEGGRVSDAELIANIVSQHSAEQGVGQNVPQRFAPRAAPAMEQLAAAIAAVDKPQAVTNVQKTISSDPGYKDGYKIDNEPKAKPVPQRAATADPLNLFGNKNGYNPFSTKERKAAGKGKLSFKDFFTNNM